MCPPARGGLPLSGIPLNTELPHAVAPKEGHCMHSFCQVGNPPSIGSATTFALLRALVMCTSAR